MKKSTFVKIEQGLITGMKFISSPYFNKRPEFITPTLLVIHNISLPPGEYGGPYVEQLFTGKLDPKIHPYFENIYQLQVSAHLFIRRDGEVIQFVPLDKRAWHAGKSEYQGRENCNDFSIGIELEGCDTEHFTEQQYQVLVQLTQLIQHHYPINDIVGHSDIAPNRKTDPGPYFDWSYYSQCLNNHTDLPQLVCQLLTEIESEMQETGLWQSLPPHHEAFNSQQPFFLDTMNGHEWLQWVFLPRMRAIIEANADLPTSFAIHPYFEEVFKQQEERQELLTLIKKLDDLVK